MAIYHFHARIIGRSDGNPVNALAYVTGTLLKCQRTFLHFNHRHKAVPVVNILLPEDAPQWAIDLAKLVSLNRQRGIQHLSDLGEAAEKRKDSQVYRELEFALPRELSDEQNIKLAHEFIQDQCCKLGMLAVVSFHFEVNDQGERFPHCHVMLLTRRLTEQGLEVKKERSWNCKKLYGLWREQWAAYANFHLRMHGFEASLDHRSYAERGIDMEPQSKLGRKAREMEARVGINIQSLPQGQKLTATTDKGQAFQQAKLKNIYRLMARPEIVFDIVTEYQSTFMWGDVQKVLARYVDDIALFQSLDAKLKESAELVALKEISLPAHRSDIKDGLVYTSRGMIKKEQKLVKLTDHLRGRRTHPVKKKHLVKVLHKYNQKFAGGLSPDQVQALEHMVSSNQLSCVVGYAGAGKTTALEAAKEIWEKSGYAVYGLAPTGRASEKLKENGFKSFTIDKFLWSYDQGRFQFDRKSILVLDEGGMVNTDQMSRLLEAVKKLGVKVVVVGDGSQLPAVEAGPAFRLVIERAPYVKLEYIVRQKEDWQKEATVLFGQNRAREAILKYDERGCIKICSESRHELNQLLAQKDYRGIVSLYNLSRRIAGNIYHEMEADLSKLYPNEKELWKYQKTHRDYSLFKHWKDQRQDCVKAILDHLKDCRPHLKELGVDPVLFALNCVSKSLKREEQLKEAHLLARRWNLPQLDPHQAQHICDPRAATKKEMVQNWYDAYRSGPPPSRGQAFFKLMMTYSNKDTRDLNEHARLLMKQEGIIDQKEYRYIIHREEEDDFGKLLTFKEERALAKGDRFIFTRNDNGLKVSNGTTGTVVSLRKHKIKVRLDNSKEIVSFAPKLYPYFDQGWATTIHKNQSVTTKQALLLASFEMDSNLTDVGMTRHEESVEVYVSELDCWRKEKVLDRLARSQEKLSSFDYVDEQKIKQLIKRDHDIITRSFRHIQNKASALTYVSKRWAEKLFGASISNGTDFPIAQASLDEAERARILFGQNPKQGEIRGERPEEILGETSRETPGEKGENHNPTQVNLSMSQNLSNKKPHIQRSYPQPGRSTDLVQLIEEVNQSIDIGQLARSFIPNPKIETAKELKFSGGVSINKEDRTWYSFIESIGGGAYGLIKHFAETKGARETLAIARDYCYNADIKSAIDAFLADKPFERQAITPKRSLAQDQRQAQLEQEQKQKRLDIQRIVEQSKPISGTQAETYLRSERGIKGGIQDTLRYLPAGTRYTYKGKEMQSYSGALLSLAQNDQGELQALQMTAIQNGKRLYDQTGRNKLPKLTYGMQAGSFVALGQNQGEEQKHEVAILAEGVETALSIQEAFPNARVYAGLGINNLKNFKESAQTLIICADWDGERSETHKLLTKNIEDLKANGYDTYGVWPATGGDKKIDFNDILLTDGKHKLKIRVEKQLPKGLNLEPEYRSKQREQEVISDRFKRNEPAKQSVDISPGSWIRPVSDSIKPAQQRAQITTMDHESLQEKDPISHYLALKAERSQLSIINADEAEKRYIVNLRKQIQQAAFIIGSNQDLMIRAQAQGIDAPIKSDKAGYQSAIARDRERQVGGVEL